MSAAEVGDLVTPRIAMDPEGNFVVVWSGGSTDLLSQRYTVDGTERGGNTALDVDPFSIGVPPTVGLDCQGDFVATWVAAESSGGDISGSSIQMADERPLEVLIFADGFESGDTIAW